MSAELVCNDCMHALTEGAFTADCGVKLCHDCMSLHDGSCGDCIEIADEVDLDD